jgi:hypothetical protein
MDSTILSYMPIMPMSCAEIFVPLLTSGACNKLVICLPRSRIYLYFHSAKRYTLTWFFCAPQPSIALDVQHGLRASRAEAVHNVPSKEGVSTFRKLYREHHERLLRTAPQEISLKIVGFAGSTT